MRRDLWLLAIIAGGILLIAACGGGDSGDKNPGGFTPDQAGARVSELLIAKGCDTANAYSAIKAENGKWKLRAGIGLITFNWTFDPVTNTVTEDTGRCKAS